MKEHFKAQKIKLKTVDSKLKASSAPLSMVLFIGVIIIFLILMTSFTLNQGLPSIEIKEKMERIAFFERAKSILNTLDNVDAGTITETLAKKTNVELKEGEFIVGDLSGKIQAKVEPGNIFSEKVIFTKKLGGKIRMEK